MSKHAPTDWKYNGRGAIVSETPVDGVPGSDTYESYEYYGGHIVCESITESNAEYILRACNAHDELLAACEAALPWFEDLVCGVDEQEANDDLQNALRAAIVKAKGESNAN